MILKIENMNNPVVEKAENGNVPNNGALIHIFFEPFPRFVLTTPLSSVTYFPERKGAVRFMQAVDESKKWDPSTEVVLRAWQIITAFIMAEMYLASEIGYTPQLMQNIIRKFQPSANK